MTAIEKAHFFLEIGKTLEKILAALDDLEEAHQNWLQDAKDVLEQDNDFGTFTISIEDILKVRDSFLEDDFCATYFGIKQLNLLFFAEDISLTIQNPKKSISDLSYAKVYRSLISTQTLMSTTNSIP